MTRFIKKQRSSRSFDKNQEEPTHNSLHSVEKYISFYKQRENQVKEFGSSPKFTLVLHVQSKITILIK